MKKKAKSVIHPGLTKITACFDEIKGRLAAGENIKQLAAAYDVSQKTMSYFIDLYILPTA